jgi:uncharacterized protein (TIGR00661 family)
MKVLFGLCAWGIGHATRSLPLIKKLISEGNEVTIATSGRALRLLKNELGKQVKYITFPAFPNPYTHTKFFVLKFSLYLPSIIAAISRERLKVSKLVSKYGYDMIISDHAYGFNSKKIPSYLIIHQIRFILPRKLRKVETFTETFNKLITQGFSKVLILDFEKKGLSGDLSHNLNLFNKKKICYMGPTSSFERKSVKKDIDYLISISGPEPQRTIFEEKVLEQIQYLKGKIVVTTGKPEKKSKKVKGNVTIYNYLTSEERENLLSRAKMVISRSGYSTVCDVAEVGAKAFFIPTPQQTEQEYLAKYLEEKGWFYSKSQADFNLVKDLKKAEKFSSYPKKDFTRKSVKTFMKIIK